MYGVELYAAVRLAVVDEGLSHHEAGRRFGIDRRTVKKMLSYSAPPGYRRTKPVRRPKLDGFTGIVDAILEADTDPEVPRKQRHTAHRIFERLRDEHGFTGGYTIVKDYVRSRRQSTREAFVPLHHPPGHAQVDFGEAVVEGGGRREKVAFFCLILPHSNVWFVKAYPRETTEAFLDGHVSAFAFLGGVPRSILYDNTTLAVARILGDGTRRRTQAFTHLQSHYLFRDRFGRPGKGNDKGKVEALVKTARRRFMVPIPKVHDLSVLNERLLARCLERLDALEAGGQAAALLADLDALRDLPAVPFEACEHVPGQISSTALVRYRLVDYSAPAAHAHKKVMVKGYVDRVEIALGAEIVARHRRSYVRGDVVYDPLHYLSLLEKKPGALDQAAPLRGWKLDPAFDTLRRLLEARFGPRGILDAGDRADVREHFLGPVMYLAAVDPLNAHWSPYLVYDGQQRLTTVSLILEALARHLRDDAAPDGFEPAQIRNDYLLNAYRKGDLQYRLLLKPGDSETLLALIHDRPRPASPSPRILNAFAFFEKRVKQLGPDVSALCAGLCKLRIVAFDLKEGEDNPHRIFETMNACGRDLSCADMVGNFILMPLDRERQERLYADHLYPIECGFERHGGEDHFDAFIRHYLTLRTGEVPKQGEEYAVFRTHARSRRVQEAGPEKLAGDLRTCADHYRAIVLGEEPDPELAQAFRELARLEMKPVFPFLLHLYGDYAGGRLSRHDLITLTRLVTAYAMRRAVCGYKPAALPPVFAKAPRAIDPDRYVESVRAHFLSLPDGHAFPSDDAFRAELTTRNMYRFRHRDAVLERLENHGRKETVQLASYTVDHIMPQGERQAETPAWRFLTDRTPPPYSARNTLPSSPVGYVPGALG